MGLVIVGFASGAFAQFNLQSMPPSFFQMNTVHESGTPVLIAVKDPIDTYGFFPQIDLTIGQRSIKPRPGGSNYRLERGLNTSLVGGGVGGNSRAVPSTNFPGLQFTGSYPPDPHIATGPGHVVQVVNSNIGFYNKNTGVSTFSQASTQFFAGMGANSFQFDPKVIYDQFNNRWMILFLATNFSGVSQILLATSDDSDPNGTWNRYLLDSWVDMEGTDSWFDYPMVGYTGDALAISGNMFSAGFSFTGSLVFIVPTAGLYAGTGATAIPFPVTSGAFSIQMAKCYTPGTTTIYGAAVETFTSMRLYAFAGVDTVTPTLTSTTLPIQGFTTAGQAPSGGSGPGLDTLSSRMMEGAYRDGFGVFAHTVINSGQNRSSVRWYEFDMGTWPTSGLPSMAQQGNITLDAGQWALMPAINKNSFGDISIIYSRSSSSIFSDLVVSTRVASDPAGTIGAPTLLRSGLTSSGVDRWGDYFSVVNDPDDDATFWGNGEVVRADGWWATEIQSWTVTTGGGGGGGGVDYDAISLTSFMGTYNAGGLTEVTASDNLTFDVDSVLLPGQGHFSAAQADFLIAEPGSGVTELNFKVETNVDPGVTATGMVFLWNWDLSKFEYAKAFPVRRLGNDIQSVKLKSNLAKYVSGSGQVRMVLRAHDPFRFRGQSPSPFRLRTDLVKLTVKS